MWGKGAMMTGVGLLLAGSGGLYAGGARAADQPAADTADTTGSNFNLGEITITARKPDGLAVGGATLSADAIYTFDRTTLDDAANLLPGVSSANTGGTRNERMIYVRGFNRFEVPLSIDGIRVFLPADNRLDYGRFLTPDVAEIQVAKGYASVLDGPDGMGGAVNLVTRKPTREVEAEASETLNLGHDGEYGGNTLFASLGSRQALWYAQANFARNVVDHTDLADGYTATPIQGEGRRNLTQSEDWRLNAKVGYTPNATDEYSISYTRQEGSKKAPLSVSDPLSIQKFWTWPYWNLDSLYFLSTTDLGDVATLKTRLYRNTFNNLLSSFDNQYENSQTLGRSFNSYYDDDAYGGSTQLDVHPLAGDTASLAFHYRRDEHTEYQQSFPGGATEPPQHSIEDTYSIAASNVLALSQTVELTLGMSYDWKDLLHAQDYANGAFVYYPLRNHDALNGQGRITWRPDADSELHVSISDRARFPTLFERFSSRFGGAVSNPDLRPERAVNYELGGARQFGVVRVEGALFYSDISDVIVSEPFIYTTCTSAGACTPNAVTKSFNLGSGVYDGGEISLTADLLPTLRVGGNYTYTHRELTDPGNPTYHPTDVPTHKAFVYADWAPVDDLHIVPSMDIASDRWTVNLAGTSYFRTGAYTNAAIRADYTIHDGIDVSVGIRNLFDDNYQLVAGYPEAGRSYFTSIRARY